MLNITVMGRRKRAIHNSIHMNGVTVKCVKFQVSGDPYHGGSVRDHQHLQPGQESSPVVLVPEDAEEPPELLPLCD